MSIQTWAFFVILALPNTKEVNEYGIKISTKQVVASVRSILYNGIWKNLLEVKF